MITNAIVCKNTLKPRRAPMTLNTHHKAINDTLKTYVYWYVATLTNRDIVDSLWDRMEDGILAAMDLHWTQDTAIGWKDAAALFHLRADRHHARMLNVCADLSMHDQESTDRFNAESLWHETAREMALACERWGAVRVMPASAQA